MIKDEKEWLVFESQLNDGASKVLRQAANWLKSQRLNGSLPGFIQIEAMNYQYDTEWRVHRFVVFYTKYVEVDP